MFSTHFMNRDRDTEFIEHEMRVIRAKNYHLNYRITFQRALRGS